MKNQDNVLRIVITGGHLTPAVATITTLKRLSPHLLIHYIGRNYVFDTSEVVSHEKETVEALGVTFFPLVTGRLLRTGTFFHILSSLIKVPIGLGLAFWYLVRIRPDVTVSFGGYIALPVVLASWVLNIPIITHEQTKTLGLATKIIAAFSDVVCVSDIRQLGSFPFARCVYTGLPLRELIVHAVKDTTHTRKNIRPRILILGGTTGSVSINTIVYEALPQLLTFSDIVHQVGRASLEEALRVRNTLSLKEKRGYIVVDYMNETEYVRMIKSADIVVGRSGANTVTEVAALGKSAIFIPLPWASDDEQYKNAEVLRRNGSASIIRQKDLTSQRLVSVVREHIVHKNKYEEHAKIFSKTVKLDAAELLSLEILSLLRIIPFTIGIVPRITPSRPI